MVTSRASGAFRSSGSVLSTGDDPARPQDADVPGERAPCMGDHADLLQILRREPVQVAALELDLFVEFARCLYETEGRSPPCEEAPLRLIATPLPHLYGGEL